MRFLSLFSGAGLFDYGLELAGWTVAQQVEIDPFALHVLRQRWPDVPKYHDVRTFLPGASFDAVVGEFPCNNISNAHTNGARKALQGEKSQLWTEQRRVISTARGDDGCPTCGATCGESGMPACLFDCEPIASERPTVETGYSLLPTPTAKANHCAPSMRKWPAYALFQDLCGQTGGHPNPTTFERMMGLPEGWTDVESSVKASTFAWHAGLERR